MIFKAKLITIPNIHIRLIYDRVIRYGGFIYTGFYTIVLTSDNNDNDDLVQNVLSDCWLLDITNVIVVTHLTFSNKCAMYTYFPFTKHICAQVVPTIFNYFDGSSFQYKNILFSDKTENFYGCPITVVTLNEPPHMILTKHKNGTYSADGIDGILLKVLAKKLNFTPVVMEPLDDTRKGFAFDNGTKTGALKMVNTI